MLSQIVKHPRVAGLLASLFDVDFLRSPDDPVWFIVCATEQFSPIAGEGAGGVFLQGQVSGAILYVTSEGQAGVIASSMTEFLQLALEYPNWCDLLKFSGGGQLCEMERVAPYLAEEFLEDVPDFQTLRSDLESTLSLVPADAPIAKLHHAVSVLGQGITVSGLGEEIYDGLFGSFVLENNPMWRNS